MVTESFRKCRAHLTLISELFPTCRFFYTLDRLLRPVVVHFH